jgi:hypothetical protein
MLKLSSRQQCQLRLHITWQGLLQMLLLAALLPLHDNALHLHRIAVVVLYLTLQS